MSVVAIEKTKGDSYEAVKAAVDKVIERIGGLEDIIKPGDKVLIKPNLVAVPTDRLSGAVTRWEVSKAVYEAVKAVGGNPFIAESACAGAFTEEVIEFCGYGKLREEGIPVYDLKGGDFAPCEIPLKNGVCLDHIRTWEIVRDADVIITVPVMKTHDQTEITAGMKNCKGLLADVEKKNFHAVGLLDSVCDLIETLKPALCIVDGTYGQEGFGPVWGETVKMDLIIGSKDLVACDTITGLVMGYDDPEEVIITKKAYEKGLGEMDPAKIEVKGEKVADVRRRFKRAKETKIEGLPESFRIIFDEKACSGCYNTTVSALIDMRNAGLLGYLENMNVVVGPVSKDKLPEGWTPDNTVCVGICAKKSCGDECGLRCGIGCPPRNARAVQAMLGDRFEYAPFKNA